MDKAVVLLSGGQDSTTALFWAKNLFSEVVTVSFDYGQRHRIEIESARKIAELAGCNWELIKIPFFQQIGNSALLDSSDVNKAHPNDKGLPASFVPGRNLIFFTIAGMIAYKLGTGDIVSGVCQTDYSGYPDCRRNTILATANSLSLGMDRDFEIHTPLMFLTKAESVVLATNLPGCIEALAYSHTCYEGCFPPCGKCPSCILREKGFTEAGIADPLLERV